MGYHCLKTQLNEAWCIPEQCNPTSLVYKKAQDGMHYCDYVYFLTHLLNLWECIYLANLLPGKTRMLSSLIAPFFCFPYESLLILTDFQFYEIFC